MHNIGCGCNLIGDILPHDNFRKYSKRFIERVKHLKKREDVS